MVINTFIDNVGLNETNSLVHLLDKVGKYDIDEAGINLNSFFSSVGFGQFAELVVLVNILLCHANSLSLVSFILFYCIHERSSSQIGR